MFWHHLVKNFLSIDPTNSNYHIITLQHKNVELKKKGGGGKLLRPRQTLRVPEGWGSKFQDYWHMTVVRLLALGTGCLYPSGNIPCVHFCQKLSRPQVHSAVGSIMSIKKFKDTMGNRTRDLSVCSAMPQPTAPPHTPYCVECFRISTSLVLFSSFTIMFCYPVQQKSVNMLLSNFKGNVLLLSEK